MTRDRLAEIDTLRVLDRGEQRCAIVTVAAEGRHAAGLVSALTEAGINTNLTERAYAVLDFDDKGVESAIRVSPHYYNTEEEIETLASTLSGLVS